jgi:hypothetical protein
MRHPFPLLLIAAVTGVRCANAGCDPHSGSPNDMPGLARPDAGKPFLSCYGAMVERLTDHEKERLPWIYAEYATQNHFNADGSVVKVEYNDGTVHLLERATRQWLKPTLLKAQAPVWHPTDPNLLLYVDERSGGVDIRRLDVASGKSVEEFRTRDYHRLQSLGKEDISPDGNKLVYVGTTPRGDRHVVVYHRDRGRFADRALDISGRSVNWVQVTDTRVLVGYNLSPDSCAPDIAEHERFYERDGKLRGCQPIRIFGTDLQPVWEGDRTLLAPYWGHGDAGVDAGDRNREVWVSANGFLPVPDSRRFPSAPATPPESCWNSFVKYTLDRPSPPTCLKTGGAGDQQPAFSWDLASHVSLPSKGSRWAYVSFYRGAGDVQYAPVVASSSGEPCAQCTVPFQNEIIALRLDGKEVRRLAHHHSSRHMPGDNSYNWMPRVSVDAGGRWLLFNSNFGVGDSALATDVYLLQLPAGLAGR